MSVGARRPTWLSFAIVCSLAGILVVAAIWVAGVGDSGSKTASRPPSAASGPPVPAASRPRSSAPTSEPRPKPSALTDGLGAHRVFAGRAFSVAYPRDWTVAGAEVPAPWGTDTTIVAAGEPHTMLRVDVTTSPTTSDPFIAAEPVIAGVSQQPGYRELGLTSGTFEGHPAWRWEFLVAEGDVLLHKEDVFFTSSRGSGIAVLTAAPANAYAGLARRFTAMRRSLVAH